MRLVVDGAELPIAQLGPDFVILETSADLPVPAAEIVLQVDTVERRWPVRLPDGLRASELRTRIAKGQAARELGSPREPRPEGRGEMTFRPASKNSVSATNPLMPTGGQTVPW